MPEAIYARGVLAVLQENFEAARGFFLTAAALGIKEAETQIEELSGI